MEYIYFILVLVVALLGHEIAHAIAAWLMGGRVTEIGIGLGCDESAAWTTRVGRTRLRIGWSLWRGGYAQTPLSGRAWFRSRSFLQTAAGPAFILILAIVSAALMVSGFYGHTDFPLEVNRVLTSATFANLGMFIINMWPRTFIIHGQERPSDGRMLLDIFRTDEEGLLSLRMLAENESVIASHDADQS